MAAPLIWLANLAAGALVSGIVSRTYDACVASYSNVQAMNEFKSILEENYKRRPGVCRRGGVPVMTKDCSIERSQFRAHSKKIGGTYTHNVYNIREPDGSYIHIQFMEGNSNKIQWIEFSPSWEPQTPGDPIDAKEALRKLRGLVGFSPDFEGW